MSMTGGRGRRDNGGLVDARADTAELSKRIDNLLSIGEIVEADYDAGKVRVKIESGKPDEFIITDWIPWLVQRAGINRVWVAPEVGEQVVIFAPHGELAASFVAFAINYDVYRHAANDPDIERKSWGYITDGDFFSVPFEQMFRAHGREHYWRYLPPTGCHRIEVGDDCLILVGADEDGSKHIKLQVGNTQLIIQDGSIKLQAGDSAAVTLTPDRLQAHVHDTTHFQMDANQVNIDATPESYINLTNQACKIRMGTGEQLLMGGENVELTASINSGLFLRPELIMVEVKNALSRLLLCPTDSILQYGVSAARLERTKPYLPTPPRVVLPEGGEVEQPPIHESRRRWNMIEGSKPFRPAP